MASNSSVDYSEPGVTIVGEEGSNVSVYLRIRGLKPKRRGFFSSLSKHNALHPSQLVKNGEFSEWTLTANSMKMVLQVHKSSSGNRRSKSPASEGFYYEIREFPCSIAAEHATFEVKETRNGSFLCLHLRKTDSRTSWSEYLRLQGTLDAFKEATTAEQPT